MGAALQVATSRSETLTVREVPVADVAECAWRSLEAASSEPNVFHGRDFALSYASAFSLTPRLRAVLVEGEDGRLDGLFLFQRRLRWGLPFPVAVALVHSFAGTSVPLVRAGCEAPVAAAFMRALAHRSSWQCAWLLPLLPRDGALTEAFLAAAREQGIEATWYAPHLRAVLKPLTGPREEFPVTGGGKLKKYRQMGRRLAEEGELTFEAVRDEAGVSYALEKFFELEREGWKGRSGTAASQNLAHEALFRGAIPALAQRGRCLIETMSLDGKPLAIGITLEHGRTSWLWKIAYDETYARFSPYVQLLQHQTLHALEMGRPQLYDSCSKPDSPPPCPSSSAVAAPPTPRRSNCAT